MGNERWIVKQVANYPAAAEKGIVEIGAGEGKLLQKLAGFGPVTGLDFAPRPTDIDSSARWHQDDVFSAMYTLSGGVLVACLFLHHFEDSQLGRLSRMIQRFDVVCLVEPLRHPLSLVCGALMLPFVNRVTRHDMPVSIRASFDPGELVDVLGIGEDRYAIEETCSWRGGIRTLCVRRQPTNIR